MQLSSALSGLGLGFALGVLAALAFGPNTAPEVPHTLGPTLGPTPDAARDGGSPPGSHQTDRPRCADCEARVEALRGDVADLRQDLALASLRCADRLAAAGGVDPVEWPASLSAADHARELTSAVAACPSLSELPIEVDCGEYPCAVFGAVDAATLDSCGPLVSAMTRLSPSGFARGAAMASGADVSALFALPPDDAAPEVSAAAEARRGLRMQLAMEYLAEGD